MQEYVSKSVITVVVDSAGLLRSIYSMSQSSLPGGQVAATFHLARVVAQNVNSSLFLNPIVFPQVPLGEPIVCI